MRYLKYILITLVFCFALGSHAQSEVIDSYKNILEVIKRVQAGEKKALDDLMKIALGEHPLEISDKIKATVIYGLTTSKDTKKLAGFLNKIGMDKDDFYSDDKFYKDCKLTDGKGYTEVDCPDCVFGKCKNCKGTGYIEYKGLSGETIKSICPKSNGTGKCVTCEGHGKIKKDCPHCAEGQVFDSSSVFSEYVSSVKDIDSLLNKKISQMEKVESVVETEVREDTQVSKNMNLEEEIDIKETRNENKEEIPTEVKEDEKEEDLLADIADPRLEASFNEVKRLILNHENKHNLKIFTDIKFMLDDKTPTMVLNFNEAFYKNIGDSEKNVIHNFEKFWEARAFLNGYRGKVDIKLINNDKNVSNLLNSSE